MPFIPHTEQDITSMLASINVADINALFDEIPTELKTTDQIIDNGLNELTITRLMHTRAAQQNNMLSFIGAGAYEHHIPAAVWEIATRGEFYSAYTPYQAEASQGTLQVLYEYQTMISSLTGMDASNASLYDGASGLAEAVLMATRSHKSARRILLPKSVSPFYRRVVQNIVSMQNIELVEIDFNSNTGTTELDTLNGEQGFAALVIPQPNFFGALEEVDALTNWAHQQGGLVIALVNPVALALLKAPGQWGEKGADIAVGDGQPLGAPLNSGGPYFGFLCCKKALVRQMPGRIVGRTVDLDGKQGFTLTLQAREQHIRRAKATSNICSNQGLMVTAATIHMALMGQAGLRDVAICCHQNLQKLRELLSHIKGINIRFNSPSFHEMVLEFNKPVTNVLAALQQQNILAGFNLQADYPELGNSLLINTTETKTDEDLQAFASALANAMTAQ